MKILILGDVMGISGREAIKKNLPKIINDNKIEIRGFGTFSSKVRKARKGRNPSTGESIFINEKNVIYFNPSKKLKRIINEK